jgi:hypothetical protein
MVGLRVVHSLIQCTVNTVKYRFTIFSLASLCLLGLTVHAGARILHDCLVGRLAAKGSSQLDMVEQWDSLVDFAD